MRKCIIWFVCIGIALAPLSVVWHHVSHDLKMATHAMRLER